MGGFRSAYISPCRCHTQASTKWSQLIALDFLPETEEPNLGLVLGERGE